MIRAASGGGGGSQTSTTVTTDATTTRTISSSDAGTVINFTSSSPITVTLPNSLSAGTYFEVIQSGTGNITFSAASGASIQSFGTLTHTAGQYAAVRLIVVSNSGGSSAVYNLAGNTG